MGRILSVNLAVPEQSTAKSVGITGINKMPATGRVPVRAPGPQTTGLGSGLVGDQVFDIAHHGGDDQAVYAYAREDYDWWQTELGRPLRSGLFGDNLTTTGVDVNGALVGEQWRIGADLVLQTTYARIPCATFQAKMGEKQWVKRFTHRLRPGTYLKVVHPGDVGQGDEVTIEHRPPHDITIAEMFRLWMLEPQSLPRLLDVDGLSPDLKDDIRQRLARQ
ncbi:sulfurase [Rhizocola hellebori]|uniref:Sulfurase n=1 Tax=Rhizocola hellebori TaxID=1392758 RepID=A0A8J3Q5F3_9ACTN|nr:MOSC domain-containing protein [Rhizocola hellebori]GIH04096.1 sulfurase [Rhizocola hellebori]